MKIKKGYLLSSDGSHYSFKAFIDNYDYVNCIKLFHSKIGNWTEKYKGKLSVSAKHDGNFNTTIVFDSGKTLVLDIDELFKIQQIANLMDSEGKNIFHKYLKVRNMK